MKVRNSTRNCIPFKNTKKNYETCSLEAQQYNIKWFRKKNPSKGRI